MRVNRLIIGHSIAHGIRQGHVSGPVSPHQAGNAKHRIRPKSQRVQKFVIHAFVNDVDALQSVNGLHVHDPAVHDQIAALDEFDAHLLGEEAVFEIRAVATPE